MKKLAAAVATLAISAVSASADMAPKAFTKAPPVAPVAVYNWTGCYVGGGYGMWNQENALFVDGPPRASEELLALRVLICKEFRKKRQHQTCHDVGYRKRGICFYKRVPRVEYVAFRHFRDSCFAQA